MLQGFKKAVLAAMEPWDLTAGKPFQLVPMLIKDYFKKQNRTKMGSS